MRVRIADGSVRAVTTTTDRDERWPYWSDSARRVIFQTSEPGDVRSSDLVLWDPESNRETNLLATPRREERWPNWSPDGRAVVYAFVGGRPATGIALIDVAERTQRVIARTGIEGVYRRPTFSPDGRQLVAELRNPELRQSSLWLLTPTASPRPITGDSEWNDTKAWFTRDGARIVFTRRPVGDADADILSIAPDGSDPQPVVAGAASEHSARPSPTRDEIVYVSNARGTFDVFRADLDGGSVRALYSTPKHILYAPRWSPDGERVVATAIPADADRKEAPGDAAALQSRLIVLDRAGNVLLDTPGAMADWMPPWP
jgi:TolB protein